MKLSFLKIKISIKRLYYVYLDSLMLISCLRILLHTDIPHNISLRQMTMLRVVTWILFLLHIPIVIALYQGLIHKVCQYANGFLMRPVILDSMR